MESISSYARRAALPEVLFTPDIRAALRLATDGAARRAVRRGDCGPYLRLGRRLAVRRESFLRALASREIDPARPGTPSEGSGGRR
jgi:hypothetical protein